METSSYRFVNNRYYCHTCNSAFNEMTDPDHLENIKCTKCHGEFIELIERKATRPSDLSENHQPQTASNNGASPNPASTTARTYEPRPSPVQPQTMRDT